LPALLLLYLGAEAWQRRRAGGVVPEPQALRWLLAVLALALLARMPLFTRIYQYGFVQAALAALVTCAVVLAEVPVRAGLDARGQQLARAMFAALLASGALVLFAYSRDVLTLKTLPIASGRDAFYAFDPHVERTGEFVSVAVDALAQANPDGREALLVLPDGLMLNYLSRSRSPVPATSFFSSATADGREARIVRELQAAPPGWVVVVTRDMQEFGVARYGEREGQGLLLVRWLRANYQSVAQAGGDPLQAQQGVTLWQRVRPAADGPHRAAGGTIAAESPLTP
jgi:hypothetical protein